METYKRVFVIVLDSLGIGAMPDSEKFGDKGVDTFGHILDKMGTLDIPNLQKLGMLSLNSRRWARKPLFTGFSGTGASGLHYHCIFTFACDKKR